MKKYLLVVTAILSLTACGSSNSKPKTSDYITVEQTKLLGASKVSGLKPGEDSIEVTNGKAIILTGDVTLKDTTPSTKLTSQENTTGAKLEKHEQLSTKELTSLYNEASSGIKAEGDKSYGFNNAIITTTSSNSIGMISNNKGTVVNNKIVNGSLAAFNNSQAINRGTVNITGQKDMGIVVMNGSIGENYKTINVVGEGAEGMVAIGKNSVAKNYGTINLKGSEETGMSALNGGTIVNEESGIIRMSGKMMDGPYTVHGESGDLDNNNGTAFFGDSNKNSAFLVDKSSKVINHGKVIFSDGTTK